jgi:hypothetical protein
VNSVQRRGLINASVAAVATFAIGSAVVFATSGSTEEASPEPSPSATASPPPPCTPTWEVVHSANRSEEPTTLLGVTAVTASEGWAVGGIGQDPDAPTAVAIQRWDGSAWSAVEAPSPGSFVNELRAVDAAEPNDVWAVGRSDSGFGDDPLVMHYDGTDWTESELPGDLHGVLNGVAAISPTDVWAVGFSGDPDVSLERALVLHWDGTAWATVEVGKTIGGGKAALEDVQAVSPTDLWAVGYHHFQPAMLRFDGEAWSNSPTDIKGKVHAVEAFATSQVWAVGTPIQGFDGKAWTEAPMAKTDADLVAVGAVGAQDIWAVGSKPGKQDGTTASAVYRYGGHRWVPVDGPSVPGSDVLTAVDALPDGTVLAVGYKDVQTGRRTLAISGATCPPPA